MCKMTLISHSLHFLVVPHNLMVNSMLSSSVWVGRYMNETSKKFRNKIHFLPTHPFFWNDEDEKICLVRLTHFSYVIGNASLTIKIFDYFYHYFDYIEHEICRIVVSFVFITSKICMCIAINQYAGLTSTGVKVFKRNSEERDA